MTISAIKPVLSLLKNSILTPSEDDSSLTSDIKKDVLMYIENKYDDDVQQILDISTYLDPRFIYTYIDDKDAVVKLIVDEGMELASRSEVQTCSNPPQVDQPSKKQKLGSWLKEAEQLACQGGSYELEAEESRPRERLMKAMARLLNLILMQIL